jgi:VPDSG-CTERM motif
MARFLLSKKPMIKQYLTLLPAIALLLYVKQACAIGITIDFSSFLSASAAGPLVINSQFESVQITGADAAVSVASISPLNGNQTEAAGTIAFTNTAASAVFSGTSSLIQRGDPAFGGFANVQTILRFALTESVDYSIAGSLNATLLGSNTSADINGDLFGNGQQIYREAETITGSGGGQLVYDNSGSSLVGSNSGTLAAGLYSMSFLQALRNDLGGSATGSFSLTLNSHDVVEPPPNGGGNGVPDAGSTVMMLGMALTAIGGIRHKLKI